MRYLNIFSIIFLVLFIFCFSNLILFYVDLRDYAKVENLKYRSKYETSLSTDKIVIGKENDKIFWFIQVTDFHLSKFSDGGRSPDLLKFCKETVPLILPDFVLASGDLTDSKSISKQDSMQYLEEWVTYSNIIKDSGVLKVTKWFDIRGNHDAFNVPNLEHSENYYRKYSVMGPREPHSYFYSHKKPYGTYSVVGLDTCPDPGPKRPYNFFGIITSAVEKTMKEFTRQAEKDNMTFWFGHYPTSTIVSRDDFKFRTEMSRTCSVYMCGHLHTWGLMVPQMHVLQPEGFLELELGDWRDSRIYRIGVVDHDIFSFVDTQLDQWPVVVVTNPKNSNFLLPHKEPVHRIMTSTHIRVLVWSPSRITSVRVYLDGAFHGKAISAGGPLYVLPWKPRDLQSTEHHVIRVEVEDESNRQKVVNQAFSVTGTPLWNFGYMAGLLLLGYQAHNVRLYYYSVWCSIVVPLVLLRLASFKARDSNIFLDHPWIKALYRIANHNGLFFPIMAYLCSTAFGPIMFGQLVEGYWAVVFLHGIYVMGTFIPDYSPYITEFIQNLTYLLPLMAYLVSRVLHPDSLRRLPFLLRRWVICLLIIWFSWFTMITVYLPYGILALLMSPCRLGAAILTWQLLRKVDEVAMRSPNSDVNHHNDISIATKVLTNHHGANGLTNGSACHSNSYEEGLVS